MSQRTRNVPETGSHETGVTSFALLPAPSQPTISAAACRAHAFRRLGALIVLVGILWSIIVVYAGHSRMAHNPVRLPYESAIPVVTLIPQGWKFFTRSPREEHTVAFYRDASGLRPATQQNGALSNWLGAGRAPRAQGVELGLLIERITDDAWTQCAGDAASCETAKVVPVQNILPRPTLCGSIVLQRSAPVPWAWAKHVSRMPVRIAALEVQC